MSPDGFGDVMMSLQLEIVPNLQHNLTDAVQSGKFLTSLAG